MDAYLEIAATVLRSERRPLSPRAILTEAYRRGLVPANLHGKTQHKTLQARVSEDIIIRREHSAFFRTAPGRFFLREFITDTSLPDKFREPVPTRRRVRELQRGPALAVDGTALARLADKGGTIGPRKVLAMLKADRYRYEDPRKRRPNSVFIRSFVCVQRGPNILSYRLGRYRDDRDSFMSKRSIGFSTLVHIDEHTLFNLGDLGIVDSGVRATKLDLDFPSPENVNASLLYFVLPRPISATNDLLAVISFEPALPG